MIVDFRKVPHKCENDMNCEKCGSTEKFWEYYGRIIWETSKF